MLAIRRKTIFGHPKTKSFGIFHQDRCLLVKDLTRYMFAWSVRLDKLHSVVM